MEIGLLIKSAMGLIVVLGLLIFLFFLPSKQKVVPVAKAPANGDKKPEQLNTDMESLKAIIKSKHSDAKKLKEALDLVIKYHGTIPKKLGVRPHPGFDIYMDILFTICRHPNTNKNLIVGFDSQLVKLNPEYKKDISDAITRGLNSRGA
ncbi:MAG: hypothetical protein GW906_11905 [Epsilonproteobacteria bacterium]|nr:hypothetical protein [Campylobacterota bacterium]OIO15899.1 MAG: hypothetical protein AUJ81_06090 [Helicobacteraceae bacterium CG1_02_36_14]PIP11502.1 MAG: hypothetical protein COX50_00355 [Sulfurimonas sp. CG23_combo_of_CG06-09_8_20_14_all_36_33]PIS24772.1 MAG: hypothetical protein COT46_08285 [Sulfurimonas sp. CG08_land_8_20_14_0_20_36_33]PIU35947.1 MAG: hypothetical protein COT05_01330 [Sulfurimonas sp. CG07_land_8_20_14_0_80_36_56]PIV04554.1 MAG: hypothetical protein COS56_04525 [Sulfur